MPIVVLGLVVGACGGQIPFGTPQPSVIGSTAPPGASTVPSAAPSGGATPAPSVAPTETPLPTDPAPPTPPAVAVTYNVAGSAGLRITLPPGWIGLDSESPEAAVLATEREHPELAEALGRLGGGVLFVALDATATGGGAPSLTITSPGAVPPGPLLEALAQNTAAQISATQRVDGEVDVAPVEMPSGAAYNLRWTLEPQGGEEPLGLDLYLLSVGGVTYIVTFAAPAMAVEGFRPAFANIVATMEAAAG